jgi:FAD/FMN-containing dehydrogenase
MTAQSDALAARLEILKTIGKKDIQYPAMPMDTYLQEARYLYKWCGADQAALTAAGLDWSLVDDLPVRADAASEAQSEWHNVRFGREEAQKQWALLSPAGYELRDEILHAMRYAYRAQPELQSRVDAVAEGSSDSDMIQDLNDVSVIGRENLKPLVAVGFDPAKLDAAASKSRELAGLRADASADKRVDRERKLLRDRAYTHLKQAVDAVRQCGQFVFWKDEERLVGYASDYLRKARKASAQRGAEPAAEPVQ